MNASLRTSDMPSSIEAEQSVLGGLMLDPSSIAKLDGWLTEEDFARENHQLIYRAIRHVASAGINPDAVTLGEWLEQQSLAKRVGGIGYIVELANSTPSAANVVAYAEIVLEKARLRRAIETGEALVLAAAKRGANASEVVANASQQLSELQNSQLRSGLQATKPMVREWLADLQRRCDLGDTVTGLPMPWRELNAATHGLQSGELTVLAGRPNQGKSVMGIQLAAFSALRGVRTAFFSLEMTATQVMRRAIACTGSIDHDWLLAPIGGDDALWTRVTSASADLSAAPLLVDETPALTIEQLMARARRAHLQKPIGLLVVDHLHELHIDGDRAAHDIGRNAQGLKALGKEFNCPVVVLAQLNRALASRTDKRPTMTDLRASGEIEQKADVILFIHREDAYDAETHLRGVVEVEIGKGRDIRTGTRLHLANRFDQMRLEDWVGPLPSAAPPASKAIGFNRRTAATTN